MRGLKGMSRQCSTAHAARRQPRARLRGHHEADEAVVALRVLEAHLVLRARAKRVCEAATPRCAAGMSHNVTKRVRSKCVAASALAAPQRSLRTLRPC